MTVSQEAPSPSSAADRCWLWSARAAALGAILSVSAPTLAQDPAALPMVWPFWAPYLIILGLLRGNTRKLGLAWAMGTGTAAVLVALLHLLTTIPEARSTLARFLAPFALTQALLAASAFQAYCSGTRQPADRPKLKFGLALGAIAILVPLAWTFWMATNITAGQAEQARRESRAAETAGSEGHAMFLVKKMALCATAYSEERPDVGFPASQALMGPEGRNCIDATLARGVTAGYTFTYTPGEAPAGGAVTTFTITARPVAYGLPARAAFFSDQTRVIRVTREDRAATAEDPPW